MNKQVLDVLIKIYEDGYLSQRILSESTGYSLGIVNRIINELLINGYLSKDKKLTSKATDELSKLAPKNAVILAAGFGMRMVPINYETPKALLEVRGEKLIERLICQLHEKGIREIYVVVGFLKEQFEYLIDEYDVELIINEEYSRRNNLYSLSLASAKIENTYIIPCDIWCENNPFNVIEGYSWYMVSEKSDRASSVRVNRKKELVSVSKSDVGNSMIGVAYVTGDESDRLRERLSQCAEDPTFYNQFWEEMLFDKDRMYVYAKEVKSSDYTEINTYEQLRELDENSNHLNSDAIDAISKVFLVPENEITDIEVLKKGMTNRSFLFSCKGEKYIMRIPGEGTDKLINRYEEAEVYSAISGYGLCDELIYICPENGYKITKYIENVRNADAENSVDLDNCMAKLREFHNLHLLVRHEFNLFEQINFYESLWAGKHSIYKDYESTKMGVLGLKSYIDQNVDSVCLTHIDAVPDNFLFSKDKDGNERLQLTDWEYAGMQDPHVDIAMFCIYSLYSKAQVDELIDIYFMNACPMNIRIKIYCYVAVCGLLWSNWCEYKSLLGVEFGEYSLRQYRYAKEYQKYAMEGIIYLDEL